MKPTNRISVPRVPWHEEPITERDFSHGQCPECGGNLIPDNPLHGGLIHCDTCDYETHD